jgi:hypothetical protein
MKRKANPKLYNRTFKDGWNNARDQYHCGKDLSELRLQSGELRSGGPREKGYKEGFVSFLDTTESLDTHGAQYAVSLGLTL